MQTGHNTCLWTPERVRFMANAAACGNFPAVLARAAADGAPESVCPEDVLARLRPVADHPEVRFCLPRRRERACFCLTVPRSGRNRPTFPRDFTYKEAFP